MKLLYRGLLAGTDGQLPVHVSTASQASLPSFNTPLPCPTLVKLAEV
jgi:hypothetical protein